MGRGPIPMRRPKLPFHLAITAEGTFGISPSFLGVSQSSGQVTHVLLTRSRLCPRPKPGSSLHLHVLGTPPAFVLSQDQTLREELPQRVVRKYKTRLRRPRTVPRPATGLNPGSVPGGTRPLRQLLGALGTQWAPAQDGVNLGTAVRAIPSRERSSDGVEPGHIS